MILSFLQLPLFLFALAVLPKEANSQAAIELQMGVNIIGTIMVDVETDLQVTFTETDVADYVVAPRLSGIKQGFFSPATIRITGDTAEAMVDIEAQKVWGEVEGQSPVIISDFNVLGEESGTSVEIMPFARDESFLLVIGGKVTGGSNNDIYKGVNILNINYL